MLSGGNAWLKCGESGWKIGCKRGIFLLFMHVEFRPSVGGCTAREGKPAGSPARAVQPTVEGRRHVRCFRVFLTLL